MKKIALLCLLLSSFVFVQAQTDNSKLDSDDFIERSRQSLLNHCWIKLSGRLNSRSKEHGLIKATISCAAQLVPNQVTFKSTINGQQSVKMTHKFGGNQHLAIIDEEYKKADSIYQKIGIKSTDLSLTFMYWDMLNELKSERLGLMAHPCRVFRLQNPDNDKEFVRVWLSENYLAPVKVEWRYGRITGEADQSLQFKKFAEKNQVWIPTEILIKNKKGKTQIKFDKKKAQAAFSQFIPENLYKIEK